MDKTLGVLSFNNEIRNIHLQRNIGKYSQYKEELIPAIGDYYEIDYTRPLKSLTEGKSLMTFTHDGTSDYSARINHNYLNDNLEGHHIYENNKPVFTNFWTGDFYSYLDYVMAVYGHETVPIQFIDGILSLNFMDKALELVEPGIVRDISPIASLAGVVKTNINNFSGTDTRLGLISNQMYAKSLVIGSLFNSDRERTESFKASVITPSLITKYGNNETNINKLPNLILPNHSDGRVVEDYNKDVRIYDEYEEILNTDLKTIRISDALKKNTNQPYVGWNSVGLAYYQPTSVNYYNPLEKYYYVKYTHVIRNTDRGKYINVTTINTEEFQNSDKRQTNGKSEQYDGEITHIMYEDEDGNLLLDADNEFDSFTSAVDKTHLSKTGTVDKKSLLYKTNEIFKDHKIHTIYGEHPVELPFGMCNFVSKDTETSTTDTAKTGKGRSRGKNLLKKNPDGQIDKSGYENPFCRVWTYHNQYDKVNKLVRPFTKNKDGEEQALSLREVQAMNVNHRAFIKGVNGNGGQYLADNTVLRKTGYVNITPSSIDTGDTVDIKKCMFSIENLAWKDMPDRPEILSKEQRGPNGGRIMWFPPYDINFQENVNVNWDSNTFIGRGEKVYTYTNTERTGTLSFTLLIDHPSVLNDLHNEAGFENPSYYNNNDTEDKTPDMEGDILRFFAGCKPLKYKAKKVEKEEDKRSETAEKKDEIKKIKIYVFYPNDYSGHLIQTVTKGNDTTALADEDFAKYLICGKNVSIVDGSFVGYEMKKNNGISDLSSDDVIPACNKVVAYEECKEPCKKKDADKRLFRYRVDFDLKQNGLMTGDTGGNYSDSASFGLNLDINEVKSEQGANKKDANYTFAEFYYAVENLKHTLNLEYDQKGMNYIKDLLGDETRLNEICNLITPDCTFDKIVFRGGATKQDKGNSKMLAERRASALRWYITNAYNGKLDNEKTEITGETVDVPAITYNKTSINTIKPKSERYAVVELQYKVSDTQKLSETDSNVSQTEETVNHADAMNKLYNKMLETSEILKRYTDSGEASEQDFITWFDFEDNEYKDIYTDTYIQDNIDNLEDEETFYELIRSYCDYVYPEQSVVENTVGYSKNINLSDTIAADGTNDNFMAVIAKLYDIEKINEQQEKVDQAKKTVGEKRAKYDEETEKVNKLNSVIKSYTSELNKYEDGSPEYNSQLKKIEDKITERDEQVKEQKKADKELIEAGKELTKETNTLARLKQESMSKDGQRKVETLYKEIKNLDTEINKLGDQIAAKETEIKSLYDELEGYLNEAAEGATNCKPKINTVKSKISNRQDEEKKLTEQRDKLNTKRSDKQNQLNDYLDEVKAKYVYTEAPSLENTMYTFDVMLSPDVNFAGLYDNVILTGSMSEDDEFFKDYNYGYKSDFNNLISGFIKNETTSKENKMLNLWTMHAIQILIRWIEVDICNNSKDLFKYAFDIVGTKDKLQEYITLLVAKTRINNEPEKEFNIDGVWGDLIVNSILTDGSHKETAKFVNSNEPTQEMANAAVEELVAYLNAEAANIKNDASKNKTEEEDWRKNITTISENNENQEEVVVEDSASNNVLLLDTSYYKQNGHRYETESEYFSKLKDTDPIIFKQIKDKIKYFDPAFHSMSPEGFNARLTFLQQCTRQGHTIESQTSGKEGAATAGNLAFGRMPVCVLRIGDFIYSKILITSMSISYGDGGMRWDLNPEGAGVQPMMAKISMPIVILGGQSLEGPINRLQNAITFNYYANTGVYDNRADRSKSVLDYNEEIEAGYDLGDNIGNLKTVETSEAATSTNKSAASKKTKGKHESDEYYIWNPINPIKKEK